jgi:hypothetical protein
MTWIIVAVVVIYVVGLRVVARRYYLRRHRVVIQPHSTGSMNAALIGSVWPAVIWFPAVRNPEQCDHALHILESARREEDARRANELRQRRQA